VGHVVHDSEAVNWQVLANRAAFNAIVEVRLEVSIMQDNHCDSYDERSRVPDAALNENCVRAHRRNVQVLANLH
jgi:hypothetical protein